MVNQARQIVAATDVINVGDVLGNPIYPQNSYLGGLPNFVIAFRFQLALGDSSLVFSAGETYKNIFNVPGYVEFRYVAGAPNFLEFRVVNAAGQGYWWRTSGTDPLASLGTTWHALVVSWSYMNPDGSVNGYQGIFLDGVQLGLTKYFQNFYINHIPAPCGPLCFGADGGVAHAFVDLAYDDIDVLTLYNSNQSDYTLRILESLADLPRYAADYAGTSAPYPSAPLVNLPLHGARLDYIAIDGTVPEVGLISDGGVPRSSTAHGALVGTTIIPGPVLYPPETLAPTLVPTSRIPGGQVTITGSWSNGVPYGTATTFTPSCGVGTFDAPGYVLGTGTGATFTAVLTLNALAPPGDATIAWNNDQGLYPVISHFTVAAPNVRLRSAQVLPSGTTFCAIFEDASDASHTGRIPITAVMASGPTLRVNGGGAIPLETPFFDGHNNGVLWPLSYTHYDTIDEADPRCTLGGAGTWNAQAVNANYYPRSHFWYNDQIHTNTNPGATATYTFSGVPVPTVAENHVAMYRLSAITPIDGSYTTLARYTVAVSGKTVTQFDVNLTVPGSGQIFPLGHYDRPVNGYRFTDLGTFTFTASDPVTITVTVSNAAGTGTLAVDALYIEHVQVPIATSSDTITLDAIAGYVTTGAGDAPLASGLVVPLVTDAEWMPVGAPPHTLKVGYVTAEQTGSGGPGTFFANLRQGSSSWSGTGYTTDGNGDLASLAPGGHFQFQISGAAPGTNGDDFFGFPQLPQSGTYTIKFKRPAGGNPAWSIVDGYGAHFASTGNPADASGIEFAIAAAVRHPEAETGDGYEVWTQQVTRHFGALVSDGPPLLFVMRSGGGPNDYLNSVIIHDPSCGPPYPSTWTKQTHPIQYARLAGHGFGSLRSVHTIYIESAAHALFEHFTPDDFYFQNIVRPISATAVSIGPVDLSPADTDGALALLGYPLSQYGGAVCKVTFASPHPFHDGQLMAWEGSGIDYISNVGQISTLTLTAGGAGYTSAPAVTIAPPAGGGTTATATATVSGGAVTGLAITHPGAGYFEDPAVALSGGGGTGATATALCHRCGPTGGIVYLHPTDPNSVLTEGGGRDALFNPIAFNPGTGGEIITPHATHPSSGTMTVNVWYGPSVAAYMRFASEVGIDPWFNISHCLTDKGAADLFPCIRDHLAPERKCRIEFSNEMWNLSPGFWQGFAVQAWARRTFGDGSVQSGSYRYVAKRIGELQAIARTAFAATGRPFSDLIWVLSGGAGQTFAIQTGLAYAAAPTTPPGPRIPIDEAAIAVYQGNSPYGGDYVTAMGWDATYAALRRLDVGGLIDMGGFNFCRSDFYGEIVAGQFAAMDASGYGRIPLVTYEGALERTYALITGNFDDYAREVALSHAMQRHPRAFRLEQARYQALQNDGFTLTTNYSLDEPNYIAAGTNWQHYPAMSVGIGTGDPAENANPSDLNTLKSQVGGAAIAWASNAPVVGIDAPVVGMDHLVFSGQPPASVVSGATFGLTVTALGSSNAVNSKFTGNVTLSLANNPSGAMLGGTLTVAAVAGVATFAGLTLDRAGSGYTLQALASGMTTGTSSAITVTDGVTIHLFGSRRRRGRFLSGTRV